MKKLLFLLILGMSSYLVSAQACAQSCDKKSCGPEGTKTEEAAVITTMRSELQAVIKRIAKSPAAFDPKIKDMHIERGLSDDESLLFISQAANAIRYELLVRIDPANLVPSFKEHKPSASSTKQQMVANLKREIQLLTMQAEKL